MNVVETFVLSKNNDEKPAGKKKKKLNVFILKNV